MEIYHCSPIAGLKVLEPQKPKNFDKPPRVYMTKLLPMALMYGVRNFEYTYGYTKDGQIYLEEYFPDALKTIYKGKSASLYLCVPEESTETEIPNEIISEKPVAVLSEKHIPDVYDALLEQERIGRLKIYRHGELSEEVLDWIFSTQRDIIIKKHYLDQSSPAAEYMKQHYPSSWAAAKALQKASEEP